MTDVAVVAEAGLELACGAAAILFRATAAEPSCLGLIILDPMSLLDILGKAA